MVKTKSPAANVSKCVSCKKRDAVVDPLFGTLPYCEVCQKRINGVQHPGKQAEFVGDDIKEQRKAYWHDYHPAHRKGVPSREFRDRYGREAMKRQGYTDKEIDNAQYVWSGDDTPYKEGN